LSSHTPVPTCIVRFSRNYKYTFYLYVRTNLNNLCGFVIYVTLSPLAHSSLHPVSTIKFPIRTPFVFTLYYRIVRTLCIQLSWPFRWIVNSCDRLCFYDVGSNNHDEIVTGRILEFIRNIVKRMRQSVLSFIIQN